MKEVCLFYRLDSRLFIVNYKQNRHVTVNLQNSTLVQVSPSPTFIGCTGLKRLTYKNNNSAIGLFQHKNEKNIFMIGKYYRIVFDKIYGTVIIDGKHDFPLAKLQYYRAEYWKECAPGLTIDLTRSYND